jgi:hypothetical protein
MRSELNIDDWRGDLTAFDGFNGILPVAALNGATWDEIGHFVCGNVAVGPDKARLPFYVPCLLQEAPLTEWGRKLTGKDVGKQRSRRHVTFAAWLVMDVDGLSAVTFKQRLKEMIATGCAFRVYSSWSHGHENKPGVRARLILPVDKPLDAAAYDRAWIGLDRLMFAGEVSAKDASGRHLWQQQGVWSVGPDRVGMAFSKKKSGAVWSADALIAAAPKIQKPRLTLAYRATNVPLPFDADRTNDALAKLDANIYEVWIDGAFWLKAAHGDAAYPVWLRWSMTSDEAHRADEDKCMQVWDGVQPRITPDQGAGALYGKARDESLRIARAAGISGKWDSKAKAALAYLYRFHRRVYDENFEGAAA